MFLLRRILQKFAASSTRSLHTENKSLEWFKDPNNLKQIKAASKVTGLIGVGGLTVYGARYMARKEVQNELKALEARLETHFTGLETRFTGLETRFAGLETRFAGLETRFAELETRFAGLETRFAELETHFAGLETHFTGLEN
ncbi:hypothetical protein RhiirA1_459455 [Rhizophagus irregularis]|uniref:Uncharacterized protein n=1 Tax=Rhizophagus irregularis TaxID=588596 RepID=A0A2I1EJ54_9GLOM|nr:hypothetical protein RhiirA1_459455 [Rhizophagus irregularis]PKY22142.1 hypothetical protein RhiirB3_435975 [Rhizophagus irregularis]CAB4479563.1 unnamed protein product [Rhizophagus irregularis]CAB5364673.1 unnamed protein product [Rhizophagus irregularis]